MCGGRVSVVLMEEGGAAAPPAADAAAAAAVLTGCSLAAHWALLVYTAALVTKQ